jgi:hypothetical protein
MIAFASIKQWKEISGMGRSATYDALSRGDLRARKNGARTLIDVRHGLRWLRSLPEASINLKRAPRRVPGDQRSAAPPAR